MLEAPSYLVLSRTLLISVVSHSLSHHVLCFPSTEVWQSKHLWPTLSSSWVQGGLWSHQHLSHRMDRKPTATSTTPAPVSWLLPLPACNRGNGTIMGKSSMSSTPHQPYHPTYTHQICHGQNTDLWNIHLLKKSHFLVLESEKCSYSSYHSKLLAPLFTSWSYPQEKKRNFQA